MTLFDWLLLGLLAGVAIALLFYELGRSHARLDRHEAKSRPSAAMARVDLEYVGHVPVALLVDGNAADVVAWMEAAKEGPVLHV